MKKILIILTFPLVVQAELCEIKAKLIDKISTLLLPHKKVNIFIQDPNYINAKHMIKKTNAVSTCNNANFIVTQSFSNLSKECLKRKKIVFVTSYKAYKNEKNALGAIFWQKGRLNLIFNHLKLNELSIKLPHSYDKYIE